MPRKLLLMCFLFLMLSCATSIKSPITQFEYTGYIEKEGFGITVKPPFWESAVKFYEFLTK